MWILVLILNVDFAMQNNMEIVMTEKYRTQRECEFAKKKIMDYFPEAIDAGWCERAAQ